MIDYTAPPDVPPAVIEFVKEHYRDSKPDITKGYIQYLTMWNNKEIYIISTKHPNFAIVGKPRSIIYDCSNVRNATREEAYEIKFFMPKYMNNSPKPHMCTTIMK